MRAVLWMGGVVVALVAAVGASRLWAESKEKKPAPRTRIGLVNLTYVMIHYDKYKQFQEEIQGILKPFQKLDAKLQSKLDELRKQVKESALVPAAGEERDRKAMKGELEKAASIIQREIEDNNAEVKAKLAKRTDDEMKIIYKDVIEVTRSYAIAHDLDLVMQYSDAVTQEEPLSPFSIARKMNTSGLLPLYSKEGMDISQDLVSMLNQKMRKK